MPESKLDYEALVSSKSLNDTAKLTVTDDGLTVAALFTPVFIGFADITGIGRAGNAVVVSTDYDTFAFDRLGNLADAFYGEVYDAFNARVSKAFFREGAPVFQTHGDFHYAEADAQASGHAVITVYDDCLCLLPPDDTARRVPFAFVDGLRSQAFDLTLTVDGRDSYDFARLGRDTDPFVACVKERLHRFRENSVNAVRALDGTLNPAQLTAIATRMPEGVAVAMGELASVAPSYAAALEAKIAESRAAETYAALKTICDPATICVGMKSGLAGEQAEDILWFIAPSSVRPMAAVEFAVDEDTAAATFVYNMPGDQAEFVRRLNRAMEAIVFHREVISMPDDELSRTENAAYAMAVKRTSSLRFIRDSLAGRVIHTSLEAWTSGIRGYLA